MSKPKTELEWIEYRGKRCPGPSDYGAPALPACGGGKFNLSKSKSELDWVIYRAANSPAPGQYNEYRPKVTGAGVISTARPKSELEWIEHNASQLPGPSDYYVDQCGGDSSGPTFRETISAHVARSARGNKPQNSWDRLHQGSRARPRSAAASQRGGTGNAAKTMGRSSRASHISRVAALKSARAALVTENAALKKMVGSRGH